MAYQREGPFGGRPAPTPKQSPPHVSELTQTQQSLYSLSVIISRIVLKNWRNFRSIDIRLTERVFIVGPNAAGKPNLLDAVRFLRDIAKPGGDCNRQSFSEEVFRKSDVWRRREVSPMWSWELN